MVSDRERLQARKAPILDMTGPRYAPHPSSSALIQVAQGPVDEINDDVLENQLAHIATFYVRGNTLSNIAKEMGLTMIEVKNLVQTLRTRWRESSLKDFTERKAEELAKLDQLETQYWNAWELSQKNAVKQLREEAFNRDGNKLPVRLKTEQVTTPGDVKFLDGVYKCIDRRIKLMGLDADTKHVISAYNGHNGTSKDHELKGRMEYYASVLGFAVVTSEDASAGDDDLAESVDSERSPSTTSGLSDIIDAEFRDRS